MTGKITTPGGIIYINKGDIARVVLADGTELEVKGKGEGEGLYNMTYLSQGLDKPKRIKELNSPIRAGHIEQLQGGSFLEAR
jgi:hypothetical protein